MLIKRVDLDRIAAGEVDLVFRRWKRPTVKTGGQLRTAIGMLDIVDVRTMPASRVRADDARRAGYPTRAELLKALDSRPEGEIYRIAVRVGGDDPRLALRDQVDLSPAELDELRARLDRLDRASKRGPWTRSMLELLAHNPQVRAQDLADHVGLDKPTLKNDVRKLKGLGLTISHSPGYEVSPRGLAFLAAEE